MTLVEAGDVGAVAIGRNEGPRLERCLLSLLPRVARVVYVDSGSTDDSVDRARALGVTVVALDPAQPFTAARARNAGFAALRAADPKLAFVQFIDGDCELSTGFIAAARARFAVDASLAVVCGRRRERFPDASVYNRLCDLEWDTPIGEALSSGGDALMRADAFERVGGFDPKLIAGEEPELCVRLRADGGRVERIDHDMSVHDADMHRFKQWWLRNVRAGHAFAEGAALHGAAPERHWVRESRRILFYGAIVPAATLTFFLPSAGLSSALLASYGLSGWRAFRHHRARGRSRHDACLSAAFGTLGKFPEAVGLLRYHRRKLRARPETLIEYRTAV